MNAYEVNVYYGETLAQRETFGTRRQAERFAGLAQANFAGDRGYVLIKRVPIEDDEDTCEHGLAAWLCAGPMHYPPNS